MTEGTRAGGGHLEGGACHVSQRLGFKEERVLGLVRLPHAPPLYQEPAPSLPRSLPELKKPPCPFLKEGLH